MSTHEGEGNPPGVSRRQFVAGAAAGLLALGGLPGAALAAEAVAPAAGLVSLDARAFGAKGDGKTDDTASLQKAIEAAADAHATVLLPDGVYLCSTLKLRPQVGLLGTPTWNYRRPGGTILRLADDAAKCLLDITGAVGATINGLCLDGQRLGTGVHGVLVDNPEYKQEDAFRIERCQINRFTGDGVHLNRIWCFTIRHSMLAYNRENGVRMAGWDGFLLDNWFSGNGAAGYGAYDEDNSSITLTANRIEWNRAGGIVLHDGSHYNITGNYLDRSGGPGIVMLGGGITTITGNLIYRSGAPWRTLEKNDSCHARFERVHGLVFTSNTMTAGRDDGGRGNWSPRFGLVCRELQNSIIRDNVLHEGALEELVVDLGGHGEGAIIRDNPGSLRKPPAS